MPTICYSASVVCPMSGPPLADGAVLVTDGTIVAVGTRSDLAPRADRSHHVDGVLLPGLVDGHTSLEHSDARQLARPGPFHMWVRAVMGFTRGWSLERWTRSAHRGVQDALRHGVTSVVDQVIKGPAVPAASKMGLHGYSLVQVAMVDITEQDAIIEAVRTSLQRPGRGRTIGVAPHSPYSLGTGVLQALGVLAREAGRPLQIRVAESNAEIAAIRQGDGPLVDWIEEAGLDVEWVPGGVGTGSVTYLRDLGLLGPGTSVVHGVWVDLAEARMLAGAGVPVVCCPRANAMLQVGDAPLERFIDAAVPLALGTGSAAAVGNADILAEAAEWVELARRRELVLWPSTVGPVGLEEAAVRLATVDGARAMGLGNVAGILEPGRPADMVGVSIHTDVDTVYADLLRDGPGRQVLTVLGGIRRSRRADADTPWPPLEEWKDL